MVYHARARSSASARKAFELARNRRRKVTSVDQVERARELAALAEGGRRNRRGYPDIALDHLLVDNCAMQLIPTPRRFDIV